jgi:hypothetical protein
MATLEAQNPKRPLAATGVLQRVDDHDPVWVGRAAQLTSLRLVPVMF